MPYEEEVKTWPQYKPSKEEVQVVADLQKQGAPLAVYYIDRGAAATASASKDYHEIWFFKSNTQEYHGESSSICAHPQLAIVEMQSSGVIAKPA